MRSSISHLYLRLLVLLLATMTCRGADSPEFLLSRWQMEDGLPQSSVSCISQTRDGFLWLGTFAGLVRFDGSRFEVYTKAAMPELPANYIRCLLEDREGSLWLGCDRGAIGRLRAGKFETLITSGPRTGRTDWVSSLAEDAEGAIWAGFSPDVRVARYHRGEWRDFGEDDGLPGGSSAFVHRSSDGKIWVVTSQGCAVFVDGWFNRIDLPASDSFRMASAREGGMWLVRDNVLERVSANGSREEVTNLVGSALGAKVRTLYEDSRGALWIGTRSGLYRYYQQRVARVPTSHADVLAVGEDREGNLWVGTAGDGLNRLRPRRFSIHNTSAGLGTDAVVALCADRVGGMWLAPRESRLVRLHAGQVQFYGDPAEWPARSITTLCPHPDGGLWIGTDGDGLWRFRDGTFEKVALTDNRISALLPVDDGVWVGTLRGSLFWWREGELEEHSQEGGLLLINALARDGETIWVGTERGSLFRRNGGAFEHVPIAGEVGGQSILTITTDRHGVLWIGTFEGGLLRLKDGVFGRLTRKHGLPDNDIRQIVIDENDRFWIGTARGLYSAERASLEAVLDGKAATVLGARYGRADGLDSVEFFRGFSNATAGTADGMLWMASDKGAVAFRPEHFEAGASAVAAVIESLAVDGVDGRPSPEGPVRVPPNPTKVEFAFTAPVFSAPERLRFRYALHPIDRGWIDAGPNRTASFLRLPPGDYEFRVSAATDDASWQAEPARMAFHIAPAFYQTLAFHWVAALGGIILTTGMARMLEMRRVRRRMQMLEQQTALERERARIARDMHDDVGSRVTRIALLSELAIQETDLPPEGKERIAQIAEGARDVTVALDQIVWTVNPSNDTLPHVVGYLTQYAQEFMAQSSTGLELDLPESVPDVPMSSDVRHHIMLAFKEALNNVVKHAHADLARVRLRVDDMAMEIVVTDDGSGFERAGCRPRSGLGNMDKRMEEVGGRCEILSVRGGGTTVRFVLPLSPSARTR